jgi:hypothetical protein
MPTRPVKDSYEGIPSLHECGKALNNLLKFLEGQQSTVITEADCCPRCGTQLRGIRVEPNFRRVFVSCPECYFFTMFDRNGRVMTFSRDKDKRHWGRLCYNQSPPRPLERQIKKHMGDL